MIPEAQAGPPAPLLPHFSPEPQNRPEPGGLPRAHPLPGSGGSPGGLAHVQGSDQVQSASSLTRDVVATWSLTSICSRRQPPSQLSQPRRHIIPCNPTAPPEAGIVMTPTQQRRSPGRSGNSSPCSLLHLPFWPRSSPETFWTRRHEVPQTHDSTCKRLVPAWNPPPGEEPRV